MAKPKLYIHMGTHRTATTSIQSFLYENRAALAKQGVLYPFDVRRHQAQINLATKRGKMDMLEKKLMEQVAAQRKISKVILSDEDICFVQDLEVFAKLKEQFDLHFVLFMRRQDLWLESWYMQNVKWQFFKKYCHLTFAEFFDLREDFFWMDYDQVIRKLENFVAPDHIHLAIFERAAMGEGPVQEFMSLVGIGADEGFVMPSQRNASMTPLMTEFVRHLPLNTAKAQFRGFIERACGRVDRAIHLEKVSSYYMDHAQRSAYMEGFAESNQKVAERYFGRDRLFHEPLPGPEAALADTKLPSDTSELMQIFVGPMIGEMIKARNAADEAAANNKSG
ncbi:hypothetical protein [Neogemmobacter tilapiae]|uniref:Sulfotransferase domain-containing protein n=1 Tax=Neogemmobacter tilapiae TaxID=875041 RepID=A0A918TIU2_9RHOB|nr:hypothetical protein [Gemmobacter tilapiae]GHC49712.1 hypothetical protein GCM10007315_09910 [Gemmobacter tilapiae]